MDTKELREALEVGDKYYWRDFAGNDATTSSPLVCPAGLVRKDGLVPYNWPLKLEIEFREGRT